MTRKREGLMKFKKLMTSLLVTTMALGAVGCSTKTEETEVAGTNNLEGTTLKVVAAYDAKDQIFGIIPVNLHIFQFSCRYWHWADRALAT